MVLFLAPSLSGFVVFVYEISRERLNELHQIHTEDVFGPSMGRVLRSRSKVKVTMEKRAFSALLIGGLRAVYIW